MVRSAGYSRPHSSATETFEEALKSRRTYGRGPGGESGDSSGVFSTRRRGHKNFTISELGDRRGWQKTITPSSLRYENQVEVRLPLATLWVVLGNQLLIAWRCHVDVDVGWPAAVGDGHVALEAVPSSLAGKHRGPVCIVVVSPRVGEPELDAGVGDRLALFFGGQDCTGEHIPAADARSHGRAWL